MICQRKNIFGIKNAKPSVCCTETISTEKFSSTILTEKFMSQRSPETAYLCGFSGFIGRPASRICSWIFQLNLNCPNFHILTDGNFNFKWKIRCCVQFKMKNLFNIVETVSPRLEFQVSERANGSVFCLLYRQNPENHRTIFAQFRIEGCFGHFEFFS